MSSPESMSGPLYASPYAQLGGVPTIIPDVPIASVFLVLYIGAAVGHMTLFQINNRRKHKFIPSGMMFGYCMARIVSMVLRITWANYPHNVRLALAAQIFMAAGVLILYLVNLFFAQRIIRGTHPRIGWSQWLSRTFIVLYSLIPLALVLVIYASIDSVYTLDENLLKVDSDIRLSAQSFLLFLTVLPIPLLIFNYLLPKPDNYRADKFGEGKWRVKIATLVVGTVLLTLGGAFKTGIGFQNYFHPRPRSDPGWYNSKAVFWVFSIVVELIVVYLYLVLRVDLRFHVPDGSTGETGYSTKRVTRQIEDEENDNSDLAPEEDISEKDLRVN